MANELDEVTGPVSQEGRDINVIQKQIPVKVGVGSTIFEVILWVLGIIPGLIFLACKVSAGNYLSKLQQRIQHDASTIDNYFEQRVVILQNAAKLLDKSIDLDKTTFTEIAKARSGGDLNGVAKSLEEVEKKINVAFEAYPNLKSHDAIADCMQQNSYLQREITAAREQYNDTVAQWNQDIFAWPSKMIVAAKRGYTTRIPFSVSAATKEAARGTFF